MILWLKNLHFDCSFVKYKEQNFSALSLEFSRNLEKLQKNDSIKLKYCILTVDMSSNTKNIFSTASDSGGSCSSSIS